MTGTCPRRSRQRLARFQLALVFSPHPQTILLARLHQAGIPAVHWLPSFPETGVEAVAALQARHLAGLGLHYVPGPFKLEVGLSPDEELPELPGPGPWLAVAPGSGQLRKNWPLAHYYEVSRALGWEYGLHVVWLAGPAEGEMLPYLGALAKAQGQVLLANRPLARVARVLSRCRLYLGNDSGLTHLAAAVGEPDVLALFGPTDPRVWAPLGPAGANPERAVSPGPVRGGPHHHLSGDSLPGSAFPGDGPGGGGPDALDARRKWGRRGLKDCYPCRRFLLSPASVG